MKKILLALGLCAAFAVSSFAESYGSTNYTNAKGPFYLMSGSGSVKSLTIIGGAVANTVALWDATPGAFDYDPNGSGLAQLWYTNSAYHSVASTSTSVTSNYVTLGGITNIYTNVVVLTAYTSNSITTNLCTKLGQWSVPASTVLTISSPNILFARGLYATTSTTNAASLWVTTDSLR